MMNVVGMCFALMSSSEMGGAAMLAVVERVTSSTAAKMQPMMPWYSSGFFTSMSKGVTRSLLPS